jgi:hypothetical protein
MADYWVAVGHRVAQHVPQGEFADFYTWVTKNVRFYSDNAPDHPEAMYQVYRLLNPDPELQLDEGI